MRNNSYRDLKEIISYLLLSKEHNMINKKSIGKIIKSIRMNQGLTQEELAEKIDISKNYLSKVERGLSVLNAEAFLKMANVLNFSLEDFGINTNSPIDVSKNELINKILSLSKKELKAYSELLDVINVIVKILK